MTYAIARRPRTNGDINRLLPEDQAVHSWYRFVLSFPPHLVREYLERFEVRANDVVLDPFCGTGTTLVECKKRGLSCVGVEAHPMAYFASRVKLDWSPDPDHLLGHARQIAEESSAALSEAGIEDISLFYNGQKEDRTLRTLLAESEKLLLAGSMSPLPLHKTLVLLDVLERRKDERFYDHERLALAKALNTSIGNLRFGPEVGVGIIKEDAPVINPWLEEVRAIANDLRNLNRHSSPTSVAYDADAREVGQLLQPESVSAVITSPPYPNEKDYTRTMRLESIILGFIRNRAELQVLKRRLVRSNTRGVYRNDDDDSWVAGHSEIQHLARAIEARRIELGKTSGFERHYATVTRLYFGGMARHLASLRQALRPGARLAYVVGDQASYLRIMIRTGNLLASIAESLGYEIVDIDLFRTRLATTTGEQLREEVLILRWPGR